LRFPVAGNYTVIGNIGATIVPVAGVFVDRTKAAAFSTIAGGSSGGASASDIAVAVRAILAVELARIDINISDASITPEQEAALLLARDFSAEAARNTQPI
jgi:hypothetical protein